MCKVSIVVFAVISGMILSGCQHTKQLSTIGGLIIGGGAGYKIANGKNKKLWVVGGAAAGAWLGSQIGQYLEEKDQQKMTDSTQKATITGEKQTWSNPETKVSGSAEMVSEKNETVEVTVPVLKERVKTVPPLNMIGERYRVTKASNVRGGPGEDYNVLETLSKDTMVDVIGKVQDRSWMMIGFNNIGSGFMHSSLLQTVPVEQREIKVKATNIPAAETIQKAVTVKRSCRTIRQIITLEDGSEKVEKITACQGPNGWETI